MSLADVRDAAIARSGELWRCEKFIQELAWRDYYQRVWRQLGNHIWTDLEPYKTGWRADDYADELPDDLLAGQTGVDYVDHFVHELHTTGYLHNHARMWIAAYVVHGRRVKWQAGARWFLAHLLDGDEASNNLSWQWCASTFSHKPYIFNRENVLKYSGDRFQRHCKDDPFDDSYEAIAERLFRHSTFGVETKPARIVYQPTPVEPVEPDDPARVLVWIHDGMMSPDHPAVSMGDRHLFVWDDAWHHSQRHSPGRMAFMRSALFSDDESSAGRDVGQVLLHRLGTCRTIVTGDTPDPRLLRIIDRLSVSIRVDIIPARPFADVKPGSDLTRFSRYWSKAQTQISQRRS
jgi:deoxyribodipyrimidine photo-lyase